MNLIKLLLLSVVATLTACSSLPKDYQAEPTYYLSDTSDTWLGRRASAILGDYPEQTAAYLVNEGTDAFFARMALLAYAEKSIDVQYFIWHADLIGKLLFQQMIQAADRGVRVRVLLDDINLDAEVESMLYAMDQHENIEVRLYNPFAISRVGALGLMQLMPATAADVARQLGWPTPKAEVLFDAEVNIELGTTYVNKLFQQFRGNIIHTVAAYNAGPPAVNRWIARNGHQQPDEFVESISYRETRGYVKRVLGSFRIYRSLDTEP